MNEAEYINAKMPLKESITNSVESYGEIASKIAEHIVTSRKSAEIKWRPYIQQNAFYFEKNSPDFYFDAKKYYPESKPGDVTYAACNIMVEKDCELWVNVSGIVQVFFNGECLFSSFEEALELERTKEYKRLSIRIKKNEMQRLVIKTVCTGNGFGFKFSLSVPTVFGMWPVYYLMKASLNIPKRGMEKEEGFAVSSLYSGATSIEEGYKKSYDFEKEEYVYPKNMPEGDIYDFKVLYGEGRVAFAYTQAREDGFICLLAKSKLYIMLNGKRVAEALKGESIKIDIHKSDCVLIKSFCEEKKWGFEIENSKGLGLEMLDTERKEEFKIMVCGPFFDKNTECKLQPEYAEDVLRPFDDGRGGKVFWRFLNADLRGYTDTSFSGQWYYAAMLGYYGVYNYAKTMDAPAYMDYFLSNEYFLLNHFDYANYNMENYQAVGKALISFMEGATNLRLLDHIGAMGVNFISAYKETGDAQFLSMIYKLRCCIQNNVSRFSDGTFCRKAHGTMWADDFYMSMPFLANLYSQMGDETALDDILCQIRGFKKRLYMPEEKIFSHIYFLEKGEKNCVPWGRGNGWIAFGLSEALMHIPKESEAYKEGVALLREFCEGLISLQDASGMWHQVLNRADSYEETSGTAMFALMLYRGVRYGWIDERNIEYADKALDAILKGYVDKNGVLYGVCKGSGCSMNPQYYMELSSVKDDSHGLGVLLMLLCEKISRERKEVYTEVGNL